jgi:hypothetical protein|tara:strand:+ start:6428 stop:7573 length:1146 start_codon:yes stop_codon:yes gene_type:complete
MRKLFVILSLALFFIAAAGSAHAIAIVPARQTIDYKPGETIQLSFGVGKFGDGMTYETLFSGDYPDNALLVREEFNSLTVDFTMPLNATPGQHQFLVGVKQKPVEETHDGIVALSEIYSQVRFYVPYPARYAEISLDNVDVAVGKMAYFTTYFKNYGKETLNTVTGNISVIDLHNRIVAIIPLSNRSDIFSLQNTEMFGQWNTENQSAGIYKLLARVDYDGIEVTAEAEMRVGTMSVNIDSIRAVGTVQSGVVKLNIDISSMWNEPLDNIYATGTVSKATTLLADMKSASTLLPAWGKATLVLYWDVLGLDVGVYDVKVQLYYEGTVKETSTQIYLTEEEEVIEEESANTMLYGAVMLLLLAVIFLAIVVFKIRGRGSDEE